MELYNKTKKLPNYECSPIHENMILFDYMKTLEEITLTVNEERYFLVVQYKRIKNIIFKYDRENTFQVSAPYGTTPSKIKATFNVLYPRLVRLKKKPVIPFSDFTYVYGAKVAVDSLKEIFNLKTTPATLESFYQQAKKMFLAYLTSRVRHYEEVMRIKEPYNVKLKLMATRWGSNSRQTHSLNLNFKLIHFSKEIIDALIVHELGHEFFRNHSQDFYSYLRTIIPNYDELDRKLMRYIYA